MSKRISISLDQNELNALIKMAEESCRHPRDQIRFVLLRGLTKSGYLKDSHNTLRYDTSLGGEDSNGQ